MDPGAPAPGVIAEAAEIIRAGGVVIFPTTGLYGLGADAGRADAVNRLFQMKIAGVKKTKRFTGHRNLPVSRPRHPCMGHASHAHTTGKV